MKSILLVVAALLSATVTARANAAWDSVAVFYRPEKVLVQINERASANFRLQMLMSELGFGKTMLLLTADKSLKIDCEQNETAASCILRFQPSLNVNLEPRKATADFDLNDLLVYSPSNALVHNAVPTDLDIKFLNSNGDNVEIKIENGRLKITAAKR